MARVLLFGRLADIAGWREKSYDAASLTELRGLLCEYPPLMQALIAPSVQVVVDKEVVRGEVSLTDDSEVAFLPPMSGG
jgi:sulfur-carrier protein